MTIETLKRILWRLRETPTQPNYKLKDVYDSIHMEAGTDDRTEKRYIKLLLDKGLLKRSTRWHYKDTNEII